MNRHRKGSFRFSLSRFRFRRTANLEGGGRARCERCKRYFSANDTVYGKPEAKPFDPPEHYCRECARVANVGEARIR